MANRHTTTPQDNPFKDMPKEGQLKQEYPLGKDTPLKDPQPMIPENDNHDATKEDKKEEYSRKNHTKKEGKEMAEEKIKGELTFEDKVIQKIIGIALEEVDGLLTVDGGLFSNLAEKIVNTDNVTSGIETEVGKKQVAVDMDIVVEYGKDAEKIYDEMKEIIQREVKDMTHLDVIEVNVNVVDIKTKEQFEKDNDSLQDKMSRGWEDTKEFASKQTDKAKDALDTGKEKAKDAVDKGEEKIKEETEPRVE